MFYTIYKVTNNTNGKIYIGKHQTKNPNDSYYGSGKAIKDSIRKHGKHNFTKEVLFVFDNEDQMNAKERELITEDFVCRSDTYNMGIGGEGGPHFKGHKHTAETKAKVSASNKSRDYKPLSSDKLDRLVERNKDPERRQKVSAGLKGKPKSPEHREKIRLAILKKNGAVTQ